MRMCAASGSTRPASNDKSLDVSLIASEPELVMQHLRARRASESVVGDLLAIGDLRARRNSLIFESDKAKSQRKTLSAQIGQMMKEKKDQEVAALKLEVESVSAIAAKADEELKDIDAEMSKLVSYIPNLLDDRYAPTNPLHSMASPSCVKGSPRATATQTTARYSAGARSDARWARASCGTTRSPPGWAGSMRTLLCAYQVGQRAPASARPLTPLVLSAPQAPGSAC